MMMAQFKDSMDINTSKKMDTGQTEKFTANKMVNYLSMVQMKKNTN